LVGVGRVPRVFPPCNNTPLVLVARPPLSAAAGGRCGSGNAPRALSSRGGAGRRRALVPVGTRARCGRRARLLFRRARRGGRRAGAAPMPFLFGLVSPLALRAGWTVEKKTATPSPALLFGPLGADGGGVEGGSLSRVASVGGVSSYQRGAGSLVLHGAPCGQHTQTTSDGRLDRKMMHNVFSELPLLTVGATMQSTAEAMAPAQTKRLESGMSVYNTCQSIQPMGWSTQASSEGIHSHKARKKKKPHGRRLVSCARRQGNQRINASAAAQSADAPPGGRLHTGGGTRAACVRSGCSQPRRGCGINHPEISGRRSRFCKNTKPAIILHGGGVVGDGGGRRGGRGHTCGIGRGAPQGGKRQRLIKKEKEKNRW